MKTVENIQNWLNLPDNVTNENHFREGATLLLQLNRNQHMYNFLCKSWRSNIQKTKLIYELNKHLRIRLSGITLQQIEEMRPEAERIGKEVTELTETHTDAKDPSTIQTVTPKGVGKRQDHDLLPPEIQALYIETHNLLLKERSLHERLKLMVDAKPCDRHEYVSLLIKLDKQRIDDWRKYDEYQVTEEDRLRSEQRQTESPAPPAIPSREESNAADDANSIGNCRTFISRNIGKAFKLKDDTLQVAAFAKLIAEMQAKYELATGLGAKFSDKTIKALTDLGIRV